MKYLAYLTQICLAFAKDYLGQDKSCYGNYTNDCDFNDNLACMGPLQEEG